MASGPRSSKFENMKTGTNNDNEAKKDGGTDLRRDAAVEKTKRIQIEK